LVLVIATLIGLTGNDADELTAEQLVDLIWPHVQPTDGIEHLRVRADPGCRYRLAAFVGVEDPCTATDIVYHLCDQVITAAPRLNGWRVSC
jgi:hypothetical protein